MSTNFPGSKDDTTTLPNPTGTSTQASPDHAALHTNENLAVIAVETKLGTGASTPTNNNLLVGTGTGTSAWTKTSPTGTIVGTSDSQTLTNKILTSPTINTAVISNPTLTVDAIAGFSSANAGSIYGLSISGGNTITTALTLSSTATASGLLTANGGLTVAGTITLPTGSVGSGALSNPYKFSVYKTTAQSGISTATKITWNTELFDTNNNFASSTYTAPVSGFYFFHTQVYVASSISFATPNIYKNGSLYKPGDAQSSTSSGDIITSNTALLQLAANDTIDIYLQFGGGGTRTVYGLTDVASGTTGPTTFEGFLVSKI